jgi:very-short-patch-repair endonuclease
LRRKRPYQIATQGEGGVLNAASISRVLNEELCLERARSQNGLITYTQLRQLGLSRVDISRAVARRFLKRVQSKVYEREPCTDLWMRRLRVASLRFENAVVSHRAAALVHELDGVRAAPIELSWISRHRRNQLATIHSVRELPESDVTVVEGFRVTNVTRTLIDIAAQESEEHLAWALDHAWRSGRAYPSEVRRRFEELRNSGMSGVAKLERVLRECEKLRRPFDSPLEMRMWRLLKRERLRWAKPQFAVRYATRRMFVDFAYVHERLALETLGADPHSWPESFEPDMRRVARLASLGWTWLPVTWAMLDEDTPGVVRMIVEALAWCGRKGRQRQALLKRRSAIEGGSPRRDLTSGRPQLEEPTVEPQQQRRLSRAPSAGPPG